MRPAPPFIICMRLHPCGTIDFMILMRGIQMLHKLIRASKGRNFLIREGYRQYKSDPKCPCLRNALGRRIKVIARHGWHLSKNGLVPTVEVRMNMNDCPTTRGLLLYPLCPMIALLNNIFKPRCQNPAKMSN